MTTTSSSIDIQGLLQNSHNSGVSVSDALFEKIDDSLSAGSTEFRWILSQEDGLISSDNGHGMSKDHLQQSCRLHSRTTSSGDRHGRFGIGSKNAEWILTNLEGSVTKLSSDGNRISQVTINYPSIMKNEESYEPRAHGIEEESRPIWDKYAINPHGSGTITQMDIPDAKCSELNKMVANNSVTGLRFNLATTYCDALTKGVKISIQIGDTLYQIHPIDRLSSSLVGVSLPDGIHYKHQHQTVDILRNTTTGEIVSHVLSSSSDGTVTRTCLGKSQKSVVPISEESMGSLEHVGRAKCSLAWSNDWNNSQKDVLGKNGISIVEERKSGIQQFRSRTNGTELVRNGKIIKHCQAKCTKDKASFKKYYDETRTRIEFVATEQNDKIFNVQVNKSQVNEELINRNVWKTISRIRDTFVTGILDEMKPKPIQNVHAPPTAASEASLTLQPDDSSDSDSESVSSHLSARSYVSSVSVRSSVSSVSVRSSQPQSAHAKASKSKLTKPLVSSAPLALFPLVTSHSIATSDSESVSDNEEGLVGGGGAAEMPDLVPDSREVRQSVHQSITRAQGEAVLEHWLSSNQHMATLNETLVDMIKSYQNRCAPDQIHDMLKFMPSIDARCDCLIDFIKRRHQLPEDDMFKGIELFRTYSDAFGTNAHVHL